MIWLEVEDYCQDCDGFEPVLLNDSNLYAGDTLYKTVKAVSCKYQRRCAAMYKHLERQFNKTKGDQNAVSDVSSFRSDQD